jgi:DNA processing protein
MGIDTAAHTAALAAGGRTIAVVGTPIGQIYPKENRELQEEIATRFLLISQVPVLRHAEQKWFQNRNFFPERNVTMSALTEATIIVEAGDTSGSLTQARAALHQGRKLFILDSCFKRKTLTWPARFEKLGGIRVRDPDDIWSQLA